jgi:hypothetical protein
VGILILLLILSGKLLFFQLSKMTAVFLMSAIYQVMEVLLLFLYSSSRFFLKKNCSFFIRIYSLYMGDSLWQFQISLYWTLIRSPHLSPSYLKLLQEVLLREFASWDTGLLRQLAGSNVLLCQHRLSRLMHKGWALRTKGSHLIYPGKQVTEAKSKV